MNSGWAERARARRLGGDERAGMWARAEATRREWEFIRTRWRRLSLLLMGAAGLIVGVSFFVPEGFARGLAVGAMSTTALAMVYVLTVEASGTTMTRMGATAEQWTASELRPLRRHGWQLINHFAGSREIDHLLIGPAGVIVAETKWSRSAWRKDARHFGLGRAIEQVKQSSRLVQQWPEVRAAGCRVRPVIFLWSAEGGPASGDTAEVVFLNDVTVLYGRTECRAWRDRVLAADIQLSTSAVSTMVAAAVERLETGEAWEASQQAALPSFERLWWTAVGCFVAATAGVMAMLEPLSRGLSWLAGVVGVTSLAAGLAARRVQALRLPADAWLAGVVGVGALAAVITLIE